MGLVDRLKKIREDEKYNPILAVLFFVSVLTFIGINLEHFPEKDFNLRPFVDATATTFLTVRDLAGESFGLNQTRNF